MTMLYLDTCCNEVLSKGDALYMLGYFTCYIVMTVVVS